MELLSRLVNKELCPIVSPGYGEFVPGDVISSLFLMTGSESEICCHSQKSVRPVFWHAAQSVKSIWITEGQTKSLTY